MMVQPEDQHRETATKLKELTRRMAQTIVTHPDQVQVKEEGENAATIFLELSVHPEDMGRVIGKKGRVANAMRTLLRTSAAQEGMRVYLDVVEP